jgi:uncharacterized protein YxjI
MKLYLKQKVFSWRSRFFVKDEQGHDKYSVVGEIFSWGHRLNVYNAYGTQVALIRQKVMTWMPTFIVEINGREVCMIKQEFTFFKQSYRIEGLPWHLYGDFWAHEYALMEGNKTVMRLSKKWFTWGDSYELYITNPKNEILCLCAALAVDCALAVNSRSR